jgi:hypothetical protein
MAQAMEEGLMAPLVSLVAQLRAEVEALGVEMEAKRRRLRMAEATLERVQRQQEEALSSPQGLDAREDEIVSQAAQASGACPVVAS